MDFSSVYGGGGDEGLGDGETAVVSDRVFAGEGDSSGASKHNERRSESLLEALRIFGFANDSVAHLALRPGIDGQGVSAEGTCCSAVVRGLTKEKRRTL